MTVFTLPIGHTHSSVYTRHVNATQSGLETWFMIDLRKTEFLFFLSPSLEPDDSESFSLSLSLFLFLYTQTYLCMV